MPGRLAGNRAAARTVERSVAPRGGAPDREFRMKYVWPIVFGIAVVAYGYFSLTGRSR